MTPEQLDEIEKLAEAQEFLGAGSYALPLVKALREARAERDVLQAVLNDWQRFGMEREKERDEARAEAARWKEHLRHIAYEHCDSPVHYAINQLEDK